MNGLLFGLGLSLRSSHGVKVKEMFRSYLRYRVKSDSKEDAVRWAIIVYRTLYMGIVPRFFGLPFTDDKLMDILLCYELRERLFNQTLKPDFESYLIELLDSTDKRIRVGAAHLLEVYCFNTDAEKKIEVLALNRNDPAHVPALWAMSRRNKDLCLSIVKKLLNESVTSKRLGETLTIRAYKDIKAYLESAQQPLEFT